MLTACSSGDDVFRMKGKFKNFNNGELYVYSLEGNGRIDTIRIMDGKFSYERTLEDTVTLLTIFPNFSEIPVIAAPGISVKMEGDASHLREVKVVGDDANDELTLFRMKVNEQTPPEAEKTAAAFINDNPASPSCLLILNKYFLLKKQRDYDKAYQLVSKMAKAAPANLQLTELRKQLGSLRTSKKGDRLPAFSAQTINGRRVSNSDLTGEVNIISLWAVWNFESQNTQRLLRKHKKEFGSRLQLLSISIDGNPADCKGTITRDSLSWLQVCDGKMWDTPLVSKLGFSSVPEFIMLSRDGVIIDRFYSSKEMLHEMETRLKPKKD